MALVVEGARDTAALRPPALGVGRSAAREALGRGRGALEAGKGCGASVSSRPCRTSDICVSFFNE